MLHAGPITKRPAPSVNTRCATMKDLIKYLNCKFREYYYIPGKNICIDESTIAFKCFSPQKPMKWGLTVYVLADSVTFYVVAIQPYFGSQTTQALPRPEKKDSQLEQFCICVTNW
jgi:hypothetical protein